MLIQLKFPCHLRSNTLGNAKFPKVENSNGAFLKHVRLQKLFVT